MASNDVASDMARDGPGAGPSAVDTMGPCGPANEGPCVVPDVG